MTKKYFMLITTLCWITLTTQLALADNISPPQQMVEMPLSHNMLSSEEKVDQPTIKLILKKKQQVGNKELVQFELINIKRRFTSEVQSRGGVFN